TRHAVVTGVARLPIAGQRGAVTSGIAERRARIALRTCGAKSAKPKRSRAEIGGEVAPAGIAVAIGSAEACASEVEARLADVAARLAGLAASSRGATRHRIDAVRALK